MEITIYGYPKTITFEVKDKLPKFKAYCEKRSEIAQEQLRKTSYKSSHLPEDFVVEQIDKLKNGDEVWHLAS